MREIEKRIEALEKRCQAAPKSWAVIFVGREDEAAQRTKAAAEGVNVIEVVFVKPPLLDL